MSDTEQRWPSEWMRGVLGTCVLRTLDDGPIYGYAIAQRLAESGLGVVKGGTLYPLLTRLEEAGWVTAEWRAGEAGPGRKYYVLTDDGRSELKSSEQRWAEFADLTRHFIATGRGRTDTTEEE
ncbi:PadR family transcriptional regulator [Zhihengliuella halotolerans]|uniref:PadR family transcriptional regulator n=1 Tax=Zhihengliuella halotolerans TaxID=370736 RepID=A0A4Q8AD68_9MICC|nr:helix-turn-helix transcriptional regulator [Zhihengliuella halotolerans]RZU62170.1 PadR family transcriptional regulator [Zhihengliuella halotolerans]